MKIGIPKERRDEERRAAASPETVKRYKGMGLEPVVEAGAGVGAAVADQAYQDAGAAIGDEAGPGPARSSSRCSGRPMRRWAS